TQLATRTGNTYGKNDNDLTEIIQCNERYQNMYSSVATVLIDATQPLTDVIQSVTSIIGCNSFTPFFEVNEILSYFTGTLFHIFPNILTALYLTGSLTYGDFQIGSSDIDLLVVLQRSPNGNEVRQLQRFCQELEQRYPRWSKRFECSFIPESWLRSTAIPSAPRPYVNGGTYSECTYGNEWVINLYALQECGRPIVGPAPQNIIPHTQLIEVQAASKDDLIEEWLPRINDPAPFQRNGYDPNHLRAYAILTMCRILHRSNHAGIASKHKAAEWVGNTYPQWATMIHEAESWSHGESCSSDAEVRALIQFTADAIL
ncbi:MAG: aminoglycoside adenylyltransferase domain-containing protein, partial [Candidatus Dormibacteria bacterium]